MNIAKYIDQITKKKMDIEAAIISLSIAIYCYKNNIEDPLELFSNNIDNYRMYIILKTIERKFNI